MGRGPSIAGRKDAADAQKAKIFTKLIREITMAARHGGGDPAGNSRLRMAIDRAIGANMTKDTVERAVKRGSGELGAEAMHEVRYEGYAAGGVALIIDCMTDNATRTVADVRHALSKNSGHMGTSGSVAFQFAQVGQIWVDLGSDAKLEDRVLEVALEAGADDVQSDGGWCEVLTAPAQFEAVKKALADAGIHAEQARVTMRPANRVAVGGDAAAEVQKLLDWLDDLDDVQDVFHNADLP
ncbi:MAG: YebC/PmpR family DNA-binding transcriptional regulator [Panacagrimonas sp.]